MSAESLAQEVKSLLSLPQAVIHLNTLLDDPNTSILELSKGVSHDPGLTALLLKLVNSAYYSFPYKIGTLSLAVNILGRNELRNLVMVTGIAEVFKVIPSEVVDMETFWFNSVTCGSMARLLADRCRSNREAVFITGLLHAVGRLIFYIRRPKQYRQVLELSGNSTEISINAAEYEVFGFDHAELGAELCRQWKMPDRLCQVLRYHTNPRYATTYRKDAAILHVAVDMTSGIVPTPNPAKHCLVQKPSRTRLNPQKSRLLQLHKWMMFDRVGSSFQIHRYAKDYVPGFIPEIWRELEQPDESISELMQTAATQAFEMLQVFSPCRI